MNQAERIIAGQPNAVRGGTPGEWTIFCPWHEMGARHNPSCCANTLKGVFVCHGCGEKGRIAKLVAKLENISYKEAVGITGGTNIRYKDENVTLSLPVEYQQLPAMGFFASQALNYLASRRITRVQIERHNIGFCATGKYARRIIVPITYEGELINYIARDWTGKAERKVLNPPGSQAIKSIFGWDKAVSFARVVVITEGWADALAVERVLRGERFFSDWAALALGGKEISDEKIAMLKKFDKFYIMLDREAQADSEYLMTQVACFNRPLKVVKVSGKDPAETDETELRSLLRR